jgi:hypothetical protein
MKFLSLLCVLHVPPSPVDVDYSLQTKHTLTLLLKLFELLYRIINVSKVQTDMKNNVYKSLDSLGCSDRYYTFPAIFSVLDCRYCPVDFSF